MLLNEYFLTLTPQSSIDNIVREVGTHGTMKSVIEILGICNVGSDHLVMLK
jgi:hypothetical protein